MSYTVQVQCRCGKVHIVEDAPRLCSCGCYNPYASKLAEQCALCRVRTMLTDDGLCPECQSKIGARV